MRNRPLLSVCLIILCVLTSCTLVGKERFIKELRPSPLEICTTEDESVIVCGVIYRQEQKENGQMIYLKHNSVYSISNKQKFQESKIIVYINSKEKLHIGNRIKVRGTVSFYENARNPGNFDQKFYYQKQGIHGKIYGSQMQITDKSVDVFREKLAVFRAGWKEHERFRETGVWEVDMDRFHTIMETPKSYRRNFNDARRFVIDPAISELAAKTNITAEVEPIRRGRKIARLRFTFENASQMNLPL